MKKTTLFIIALLMGSSFLFGTEKLYPEKSKSIVAYPIPFVTEIGLYFYGNLDHSIQIINSMGVVIVSETFDATQEKYTWYGTNQAGEVQPTGLYFVIDTKTFGPTDKFDWIETLAIFKP